MDKALEFGDGNEVTKIARFQLPNSINADKASQCKEPGGFKTER